MQFEAYLERSKSTPLDVKLHNLYPHLFESLLPHTSRLVTLAVVVSNSSDFGRIAQHLRIPIPTLRRFTISASPRVDTVELPSGIRNGCFMHVKELMLGGVSSFRSPRAFPHITKLTWQVGHRRDDPVQLSGLLDTLEQLPVLEEVDLVFQTRRYTMTDPPPYTITLPHVQRMSLRCSKDWKVGIPPVLEFLKLPSLVSLLADAVPELPSPFPIFPGTSFSEHLPNFAELPEMEVFMRVGTGRVKFRSSSQAVLDCWTVTRSFGDIAYRDDRRHWGGLPLHSVRKLTAVLQCLAEGVEDVWLVRLLRDLGSLEHLRLEGYCGQALRRLRRLLMRGDILLGIKTLTVRSRTYDIRQAMRLKDVADGLGLEIILTCISVSKVLDACESPSDGSSEGWDLSDEGE